MGRCAGPYRNAFAPAGATPASRLLTTLAAGADRELVELGLDTFMGRIVTAV